MKRCVFLALSLIMIGGRLSGDVDNKITQSQQQIEDKKSQEKKISRELAQIAKDISTQKRTYKKLSKEVKSCKKSIYKLQKESKSKTAYLKKIKARYQTLAKKEKLVSKKAVSILSKELSIRMITQNTQENPDNAQAKAQESSLDNIVRKEVLHTYTTLLREQFKKTKSKYIKLNKEMDRCEGELSSLLQQQKKLQKKKAEILHLSQKQKQTISTLSKKKKRYIAKLNRIKKEQNTLAATLSKLHVIKQKRDKTIIKESNSGSINVRQIGSSYQHGKLVKYRGAKTISPLKSYTVTQKFGNYTDPIYKIKIFNESVILRAKSPNAKVRNVLDGVVIYAEKTAVLDNVVIVKHRNNLHTIYAHLTKIAPTIRVNKHVKKGYILGRVHQELTFEVTQDTKHINPLRLIK